ncbi:MAG: FG-GAP-like repeat-containing protein [SAR324 cluster bacterium]
MSSADINHDGIPDLIIGAPHDSSSAGAAYVVFGVSAGTLPTQLSALNGSNGFEIVGPANTYTGAKVAGIADVNGDGIDDLLIMVPGASNVGSSQPAVYVLFGQSGGFSSPVTLSSLSTLNGFEVVLPPGVSPTALAAMDINGDGVNDILIGAGYWRTYVDGTEGAGAVYVIFGSSNLAAGSKIYSSALNGSNGFAAVGYATCGYAGAALAVGDLNGDGIPDLAIGASYYVKSPHSVGGQVYIIYGLPAGGTFPTGSQPGVVSGGLLP